MKQHSSIPTFLWYGPSLTGISYLIILLLLILLPVDPRNTQIGDTIFCIGQVGVLCCMLLMHKLHLNGQGSWKKFCLFIPVCGALSYTLGVISMHTGSPVILFFPTGAFLTGLGMLIVGIQVVRAGKLKQWKRFAPLLVGLYPFVFMFPIVIITGSPNIHVIMLWGITWAVMGYVMLMELYGWKKVMR